MTFIVVHICHGFIFEIYFGNITYIGFNFKIKCEKYWPECGEEKAYGTVSVSCETELPGIYDVTRKLLVRKVNFVYYYRVKYRLFHV